MADTEKKDTGQETPPEGQIPAQEPASGLPGATGTGEAREASQAPNAANASGMPEEAGQVGPTEASNTAQGSADSPEDGGTFLNSTATANGGSDTKPGEEPVAEGASTLAAATVAPWYTKTPVWVAILLLVALALALAWLLYQKYAAERFERVRLERDMTLLKEENDEREAYLNKLRALLELDPCDIPSALAGIRPPRGRSLPVFPNAADTGDAGTGDVTPAEQQNPPADLGEERQKNTREESAGDSRAETSRNDGGTDKNKPVQAKDPASIAELLEQNTVLLFAFDDKGVSMGTGFFLSSNTIMTNAHVMGSAREAFFINKFVGKVHAASVLLRTRENGLDFAVLKTRETIPVKGLELQKNTAQRMAKVSAWGFPAAVTRDDPNFIGLIRGNPSAAPEVVYTEGTVSVVLERQPPLIIHTATVSQGNSGGPLINEQGQVVGINTMIKLDDKSYRQSSIAIPSSIMALFLEANKIAFTEAKEVTPETAKEATKEEPKAASDKSPKQKSTGGAK